MYGLLARRVLAPALDFVRGARAMPELAALEESQWWDLGRIREQQNRRLQRLVRYAAERIPYYSQAFRQLSLSPADICAAEDLVKLPILTKQTIRNQGVGLQDPSFPPRLLKRCRTGGSTGEPLRFFKCKSDYYTHEIAAKYRGNSWAGYHLGDKCTLVYERPGPQSIPATASRFLLDGLQRLRLIDALSMTPETLPLHAGRLRTFRPSHILGYPSGIALLADFLLKTGEAGAVRIESIVVLGEPLLAAQRELFQQAFGCDAFSFYRSHEVHALGCECEVHEGFHITAENVILETVDDEGQRVPPGTCGRILVTNLHSYGMPFLRYEIGDRGVLSNESCRCGRGLPLLKELEGRITDVIVTPRGRAVPGVALPMEVLTDPAVLQFQIHQATLGSLEVRILPKEMGLEQLDALGERIGREFDQVFQGELNIVVRYVDWIDTGVTGKRKLISSNVEPCRQAAGG